MPSNSCPPGAPPGSKWMISGGRFQCVGPDGKVIGALPTTTPTITPGGGMGGGRPMLPGAGGPAGGGAYTSLPGGMGGGSSIGSAGGGNSGKPPWWVGAGLGVGGLLLKAIGKNKERKAATQETARIEQERINNAKGKARLMRGILNANGYGDMMTDEEILNYVMKTPERGNTAGGTMGDIGDILVNSGTAASMYRAPATAAPTDPSSDKFWDEWTRRFSDE
jgi:hypothetical protein